MAVTLLDPYVNGRQDVTLSATAANATQVTLHENVRRYTITFKEADATTNEAGKIAETGTDGAAIDDGHTPVDAGGAYESVAAPGRSRVLGGKVLFLTADSASAIAQFQLEY